MKETTHVWSEDSPSTSALQTLHFCSDCSSLFSSPENLRRIQILNSYVPICPVTPDKPPSCSLRAIANASVKEYNKQWAERDNFVLQDIPSEGFISVVASKSATGQRKGWYDIDTLKLHFVPQEMRGLTRVLTLDVFAQDEDRAAMYMSARASISDLSSDKAFDQARRWVDDCEKSHSKCPKPGVVPLPTRVIDVGSSRGAEEIWIQETSGKLGKYVALSYCWGGPQVVSLTKTTKAQMEKSFKVSDLPQTLQDAVFATRKLGIQYLWVDAMCIIQDSKEDMEQELKSMGQTYRYAAITISAACAISVQHGFLQQRRPKPSRYPGFTLPYRAWPEGPPGMVSLQEENEHDPRTEPINGRAWTLQERLLSPRLLIYGTHELMWQCQQVRLTDSGTAKIIPDGSERLEDAFFNQGLPLSPEKFWTSWKSTVRDYTNRGISFPEDKLVAIAGLASEFQSQSQGNQYLAGLWQDYLPEGLMWMMDTMVMDRVGAWQPNPRPPVYVAPSWSWASVNGLVEFDTTTTCTEEGRPYLDILDCRIVLENGDIPTGKVTGGTLRLKGCVREARWDGITLFDGTSTSAKPHGISWMDADEAKPDVVSCLRVCSDRGLLLIAAGLPSTFCRVGVFQVLGEEDDYSVDVCDNWFKGCEVKTVDIV